ncbi:uncharacterized protein LOC115359117 [Myripristis murdjan]|uniref:uncharacterized protein LOC115359117 n=1 Tax=Myripristis murdjan TaxID=586833 RepID=UPI0011760884|nr:uncharacterized protein LOC115359117 [Myripristis murdjan]
MLRSCPADVSRLLAALCTNKMPRLCIVDGCQGINNGYLFPRDKDVRMQWMAQLKGRTRHSPSTRSFICYAHFRQDDFSNWYQKALGFASKLVLKKDAVPSVFNSQEDTGTAVKVGFKSIVPLKEEEPASCQASALSLHPETAEINNQYVDVPLQDNSKSTVKQTGRFRRKGVQVNIPRKDASLNVNEIGLHPVNMERPILQHIIDEEAILQLMENCPRCNKKCRCTKHARSPYFIVYQSCYFCEYRRKWASQPEAKNMNLFKQRSEPRKKKLPLLKTVSPSQPSPPEQICLSKPPDSESGQQLQS